MEFITSISIFTAGLLSGSLLVLVLYIREKNKILKSYEVERKKLINRFFVRTGQEKLFSNDEISGINISDDGDKKSLYNKAQQVASPYWGKIRKARVEIDAENRHPGERLPDDIKAGIERAAEKVKAA